MDLTVHNQIIWQSCVAAAKALANKEKISDPRVHFPQLAKGSWCNDVIQATSFTDQLNEFVSPEQVQRFFNEMWSQEKESLLTQMKNGPTEAREIYKDAEVISQKDISEHTDFGKYSAMDHFDVLHDEPSKEYLGATGKRQCAKTVQAVCDLRIPSHLQNSTIALNKEERLHHQNITALGRALHTIQDFFAHSNYVELLLWELGWNKKLDDKVLYGFNNQDTFLNPDAYLHFNFPIPCNSAEIKTLTAKNVIMWYGNSPEETPLVSTLFDKRDTTYSIMKIAAHHLENVETSAKSEEQFNLAISIFGFPEQKLLKTTYRTYSAVSSLFNEISSSVKKFFTSNLMSLMSKHPAAHEAIEAYTRIFNNYKNAETKDWAQAGKFRYIEYCIKKDIASSYDQQSVNKPLLPHHTLLHKDSLFDNAEDSLRFRLAAAMALQATTEILAEHFSENPSEDKLNTVLRHHMMHPSEQIKKGYLKMDSVSQFIQQAYGGKWTHSQQSMVGY